MITSTEDMAAHLLKKLYKIYPHQKLKNFIKNFRIIPTISLNPVANEVEISYSKEKPHILPLEDVINLFDKLGEKKNGKIDCGI